MENLFGENPFREEDVGVEDAEGASDQNPYTAMEGYKLQDTSYEEVGRIEETVYDAVSGVFKYIVAKGRAIPADRMIVTASGR